jgi:DNA-binding NarL/FixJ family response regulator
MDVLIVDDTRLARQELKTLLSAHADVSVVGEADDLPSARSAIETLQPRLLLDIQLPSGTGFDLLESLERLPMVIFTTAYDQHAVRAFEANALDYLVKPVAPGRLGAALDRTRALSALDEQAIAEQGVDRHFRVAREKLQRQRGDHHLAEHHRRRDGEQPALEPAYALHRQRGCADLRQGGAPRCGVAGTAGGLLKGGPALAWRSQGAWRSQPHPKAACAAII